MINNLQNVILGLIELLANDLRKKKRTRNSLLIIFFPALITTGVILITNSQNLKDYQLVICIIVAFVSLIILVSSLLAFSNDYVSIKNPFEIELKNLSQERERLKGEVKSEKNKSNNNVFNTIQLNLNQTTEYYTINKSQARKSFGISVAAIIAGFITTLVGIWLIYFGGNVPVSIITLSSSVILEIIGGLYFSMYKKSLTQLNFFYEKLENMQDTMLAIELTNNISDETKKNEIQEKIILNLIQRSSQTS